MAATIEVLIDDPGAGGPPPGPFAPPVPVPVPVPGPFTPPVPVPVRAGYTPPAGGGDDASPVSAFDRPIPVIVVGPRPLWVKIEGDDKREGRGGIAPRSPQKPEEGWLKFLFDRAAAGATGAGIGLAAAARNDGGPGFAQGVGAAAAGLSRLGPQGMAAAAAMTTLGASVMATKQTMDAFATRGRELTGFSGQIAGAAAVADMRRYRSDMREAERLGPQLARIIENQQKAEDTFRELTVPIKGWLLDRLNVLIEGIIKGIADLIDGLNDVAANIPVIGGRITSLTNMANEIRAILAGQPAPVAIENWLNALNNFRGPNPQPIGPLGAPAIQLP